jgi:hypothetical protein
MSTVAAAMKNCGSVSPVVGTSSSLPFEKNRQAAAIATGYRFEN